MTRPLITALALLSCVCTSCIDGDETVWIEPDGSGRIEASYQFPDLVLERLGGAETLQTRLQTAIDADPDLFVESIGHERATDGRVQFRMEVRFLDLRSLAAFPRKRLRDPESPDTPVAEEALFGSIDLELNDLILSLHREIHLTPILPSAVKSAPGLLSDSSLRFRLHLPVPAERTNAPAISPDRRTLEWEFLLRDHTTTPLIITAEAPLPLPWWIWFTVALLALLGTALLFLAARRLAVRRA